MRILQGSRSIVLILENYRKEGCIFLEELLKHYFSVTCISWWQCRFRLESSLGGHDDIIYSRKLRNTETEWSLVAGY
jgi:hypothetical protein